MKVITQRDLIRGVARKWRKKYQPFRDDRVIYGGFTKEEIADKLNALDGETATAQDVENIIGNSSWTALQCHECKKYVSEVVRVGEEPDYESATACLCQQCAERAFLEIQPLPSLEKPAIIGSK